MDTNGSEKSNPDKIKQAGVAVTETLKSATAPVRRSIGKHLLLKMLVLAVFALIALHFLSVITIPFPPFTTKGKIYVDSPEVYTRERLVNDRYDQDYWLRKQLKKLDELDLHLVREKRITTVEGRIAESEKMERPAVSVESSGRGQLTFDQEFRVITGIRDMIRQQILENMLDDRHDLTGNSVYGLKFDTTVIPGANTRLRAYVHVNLQINKLFRCKDSSCLSNHIWGYVLSKIKVDDKKDDDEKIWGYILSKIKVDDKKDDDEKRKKLVDIYREQHENYENWLADISKRLNRTEDSVFESMEGECPSLPKDLGHYDDLSKPGSKKEFYKKLSEPDRDLPHKLWEEGRAFYDELTRRTLKIVLGVPSERFSYLNEKQDEESLVDQDLYNDSDKSLPRWVVLPNPWGKLFRISRNPFDSSSEGKDTCNYSVWFDVRAVEERFIALKNPVPKHPFVCEKIEPAKDVEQDNPGGVVALQAGSQELPEQSGDGAAASAEKCADGEEPVDLVPIGEVDDHSWKFYVEPWVDELRDRNFGGAGGSGPRYDVASTTIDLLLKINEYNCDEDFTDLESCEGLYRYEIFLPSGFFNFVEHLRAIDAYSYAIFPKNDVVGILAETSATLSGGAPGAGFLGLGTGLSESRTASVLVGYGDGKGSNPYPDVKSGDSDDSIIAFGWVISARGDMEPTMKNQLALVSVPAWTDKLELTIHVGWLDRESNPINIESFTATISVPPDYEAFDSIFRKEAWVTHGPRIQDDAMDKDIYVRSGKKVKILIPGSRLWRSATVTLGAQQAERIRVLPNMEGIIAEFDEIDLPHAAYHAEKNQKSDSPRTAKQEECGKKGKLDSRPVSLRVWTSEGVAKASRPVCVFYDMAEVESGWAGRKIPTMDVSESGSE